jgi:hypothetical protein
VKVIEFFHDTRPGLRPLATNPPVFGMLNA